MGKQQYGSEALAFIARRDAVGAEAMIKTMEADDDFMESIYNQQFVCTIQVSCALIKGDNPAIVFSLIKKGLRFTIPHFSEKYIIDYLLTSNDIVLINQLACLYWDNGEKEKAIETLKALMANFDNACVDTHYRSRYYPTLIFNLTKYLNETGKNEEALALCDKGIDI